MTQVERLEAYLNERGSIDPIESWQMLGIYRLGARIYDLKQRGIQIKTETTEVKNRYGEVCRVARYRIVERQQELFA